MIAVVLAQARRRYGSLALQIIDGEPALVHAVRALRAHPALADTTVLVAVPTEIADDVVRMAKDLLGDAALRVIATRGRCLDAALHDVITALDRGQVHDSSTRMVMHDLRRAFVDTELVRRVIDTAERLPQSGAVVPVHHLVDTVKEVDASGRVVRTVRRESLGHLQTPQVASLGRVREVHRGCPPDGDPALLSLVGIGPSVVQVPGDVSAALADDEIIPA